MKNYQFTSGTSRGDMIMGLVFPVGIIIPTSALYLILFYLRIWDFLKGNPFLLPVIFLPGILLTYLILKKVRNKSYKKFVVCLDKLSIVVRENGNEVMRGKILFCDLKVRENKFVKLDIVTEKEKVSFRARPMEYKTVTGNTSFNPFGTSDAEDMGQLRALGREINRSLDMESSGGV